MFPERVKWHLIVNAVLFIALGFTQPANGALAKQFKVTYQILTPWQWGVLFGLTGAVKLLVALRWNQSTRLLLLASSLGAGVAALRGISTLASISWLLKHDFGLPHTQLVISTIGAAIIWGYIAVQCFLTSIWAARYGPRH